MSLISTLLLGICLENQALAEPSGAGRSQAYEELARARNRYYEAAKSSRDKSPAALSKLRQEIVGPAQNRYQDSVRATFNQVNEIGKPTRGEQRAPVLAGTPPSPSPAGSAPSQTAGPRPTAGSSRERVVLDGSKVPRVLEFNPRPKQTPEH